MCCKGGLFVSCALSVLKELDVVMGEDVKNKLKKLGKPHLSQFHAILLKTSPAYYCVKGLKHLTWYQPPCPDLSQQLSHWIDINFYFKFIM